MAVFYKSDSVPAAIEEDITLPRPVGTIVTVSGAMYRSTNATVATYTGMDTVGSVNILNGETLTFDTTDVVFTPDGTDVAVTGTGEMAFDDDVLIVVDPAAPTQRLRFDAGNVTAGQTRVITMADNDVDLAYAVQRALVTIPAGGAAGQAGDLNTTPVTVVAAPAAGFFIEVVSAHFFLDFNSAAYDTAATTQLRYTNGAGATILGTAVPSASLMTAAADAHVISVPADNIVPVAATPVVVHTSADAFGAAGDSPLVIEVLYRVLALSPA